MLLEKLGKCCFGRLSPFLFYALLFSPIALSTGYFLIQMIHIEEIEDQFYTTCAKGKTALKKKKQRDAFIQHYSQANPYFLDEQIESLSFLQKEQNALRMLIEHPAIADTQPLENRLAFLTKGSNRFAFAEEAIRSSPLIKETEEKQKHPVEMNEEDLKEALSLIEDISIESYPQIEHRPQLIITEFHLNKKETPVKTHVFEVDMRFTKREFIQ